MTSPATMWLMGLLLIVGTVALAACGEQGAPSPVPSSWDEEVAHALVQYLNGGSPFTLEALLVTETEFTHLLSLFEPDLQSKIEGSGGPVVLYRQNSAYILQSIARLQETVSRGDVAVSKVRVEERTNGQGDLPRADLRVQLTCGDQPHEVSIRMVFMGTTDRWVIADPMVLVAPAPEGPSWAHVAPEQIAEAKQHGVPVAFENDQGMRFVMIPAGTFMMGSPEDEEGRWDDETQHEVTISQPFYMSIHEVTNEQYWRFRPEHDRKSHKGHSLGGDQQPVVNVSQDEATAFAVWLSDRDCERTLRLPTEAEWEYACRAGTTTRFSWGDDVSVGWQHANASDPETVTLFHLATRGWPRDDWHRVGAPVGSYLPNSWCLYDLHGNVWEWCRDGYGPYPTDAVTDPTGSAVPELATLRGGSWRRSPRYLRSASRNRLANESREDYVGFRLVSPLPEPGE